MFEQQTKAIGFLADVLKLILSPLPLVNTAEVFSVGVL